MLHFLLILNNILFVEIYRNSYALMADRAYEWDDSTLYFYVSIIICVMIIGMILERLKNRIHLRNKNYSIWFLLAGILLILVSGLRGSNVGMDTLEYKLSFEKSLSNDAFSDSTIEPGYRILTKCFAFILPNADIYIFIISTITIVLFFSAIWKYRNSVNLFAAFSIYVSIYYFQSFNLIRIYLAAALMLFFFHYLFEGKYKQYIYAVLLISSIHYSTIIMLFPIGYLWLYKKNAKLVFLLAILLMIAILPLTKHFEDYILIARYAEYAEYSEATGKIGVMLFFDFIPCFVLMYYAYRIKIKNQWSDLLAAYTFSAFFFRVLSYYLPVGGRLQVHFVQLFVIIVPYFLNLYIKNNQRFSFFAKLFLILYLVIRIHFYFIGYLSGDGIMPYNFVWNN